MQAAPCWERGEGGEGRRAWGSVALQQDLVALRKGVLQGRPHLYDCSRDGFLETARGFLYIFKVTREKKVHDS